jgi:hypothetical protein
MTIQSNFFNPDGTSGEAQHLEAARLGWAGGDGRKCRGNHSGARIGRDADQPS